MDTEENIFLVEILGMTNHCNLRCTYCDWEKQFGRELTEDEIENARQNLLKTKEFIKCQYPQAQVVEYSGGEPFLYPELTELILEIFDDYWVRINTNGITPTKYDLKKMQKHGKAFLALSLDGMTVQANKCRGLSESRLQKILFTIDLALYFDVPVMLLCTINRENIDYFSDFLIKASTKWREAIELGKLVLPAHIMSTYGTPHPKASTMQWEHLKTQMADQWDNPLVRHIKKHYEGLLTTKHSCTVHSWAASIHFLGENLILKDGYFTAYRCGMRGVGKIGEFAVQSSNLVTTYQQELKRSRVIPYESFHCGCFVDWYAIDLIIKGEIPLDEAKQWFVLFRDQAVLSWLKAHHDEINKNCGNFGYSENCNILQKRLSATTK